MNELPDDLSRRPTNPFELLGVQPGVSERDLRRAYVRLIRVYKPEQHPEHFRRIREAYEQARTGQQFLAFFDPSPETPATLAETPPGSPPASTAGDAGAASPESTPRKVPERSVHDELDDAWNWAVEGDETKAYARLLELHNQHPQRPEICIRLYCLLKVAPELDSQRTPCDFLVLGLRHHADIGVPCYHLYQREIEANPAETLTARFADLMDCTTQPALLASYVKWRWSAAGSLNRFDVIGNDLPGLRSRLARDQEEIWLRLLAAAADQLAWAPVSVGSQLLAECLNEIKQQVHLQLTCGDVFDRLDVLEPVASAWPKLIGGSDLPAILLELFPAFWSQPFFHIRWRLIRLLAAISASPDDWLVHFDTINALSPELLTILGQMLDAYELTLERCDDGRESAELAVLARRFLEEHAGWELSKLRSRLLEFCLRDFIDPEIIAELRVVAETGTTWALAFDPPLRYVYRACCLFRS